MKNNCINYIYTIIISMRLVIILLFTIQLSYSQIYEVGIAMGGSNFIGDVGDTSFVAPNEFINGIILKWNRSPRHSYRLSILSSKISADDSNSKDPRRIERDLLFENNLFEISSGMEFTFFDFNLHEAGIKYTPYLFTGLVYTKFDKLGYQNNAITNLGGKTNSLGIPFILGFKYRVFEQLILSAEIGSRFMFTDNIDGSLSNTENYTNFGNINNNDWYVFSLINLSYTFGRKPCYCNY